MDFMKRNGKIELMRFVFCISIVIYHINKSLWNRKYVLFDFWTPARNGHIGVEFFFLVSGFLMAKHIYRLRSQEQTGEISTGASLADETLHFLWGKVKGLLPYHLFFSAVALVLILLAGQSDAVEKIISYIPGLFFLYGSGIASNFFLNVEWYISCMLFVMAIVYPLCKRFYINFTHLFGPLFALMLLGYLSLTIGSLGGVKLVSGVMRHCTNRALAEIILGASCFEACRFLQKKTFFNLQRGLFSLLETVCYGCLLLYIYSNCNNTQYDFYCLLLLCVAVTLSFSQVGLLGRIRLWESPIFNYLGAISMPIYLVQVLPIYFSSIWMTEFGNRFRFVFLLISIIGFGILSYHTWTAISKAYAAKKRIA